MRVYVWAEHTAAFPANTGIQRVARGAMRSLIEAGAEVAPLRWAAGDMSFAMLDGAGADHLARWNGPERGGLVLERPASFAGQWLLVPELVSEPHRPSLRALLDAAKRLGLKTAVIFFDAIPVKHPEFYPKEAVATHGRYMEGLAAADLVLPISLISGADLSKFWTERKLLEPAAAEAKVRPCVLPGEFRETARVREQAGPAPQGLVALCVGTVEPRKNHLLMVEAFREAVRHVPDLKLVIAGGCPFPDLRAKLAQAIAATPKGSVRWQESPDDAELNRLYAASHFTIYPSLAEGFGLPILESLWHGRPVICGADGGCGETAAAGGCLTTDVRSAAALADAIVRMAGEPGLRERLGAEAVSAKLKNWPEYGREIVERLREVHVPADAPAKRGYPVERFPKPLLSICVTTYNRAAWLTHSLALILEQTKHYQDLVEVVVCDNASPDDTANVVRGFGRYANLSYHRNEKNVGMLGNLAVTCNHAKGRYVWVIGDDDLLVEGTIERVLAAIIRHPETELLYLNYAYTHFDKPDDLRDVGAVVRGAHPISLQFRDEATPEVRHISTKSENCFTAIYCLIYREDHARRAYNQDTSGAPFTTLPTCVPSSDYIVRHMSRRPGYWIGDPCVVVNMNVSWMRYAPLYVLERFPELHELMEANGADRAAVDELRTNQVPNVLHWFEQVYGAGQQENLRHFSVERLVRRYCRVPAFRRRWPEFRSIYERAHRAGAAGPGAPDIAALEKIYDNQELVTR